MAASKPVHEADALATIIPFRPRRSQMAPHPSVRPPEPLRPRPPTISAHDLMWSRGSSHCSRRALPHEAHCTGARPMNQSRGPFDGTFVAFLAVVGFVIGEGLATDLAGQLASLAFGSHHVVPGGVGTGATRLPAPVGPPR